MSKQLCFASAHNPSPFVYLRYQYWCGLHVSLYKPGNTPLVRINSLSDALGVEILVSQVIDYLSCASLCSGLLLTSGDNRNNVRRPKRGKQK